MRTIQIKLCTNYMPTLWVAAATFFLAGCGRSSRVIDAADERSSTGNSSSLSKPNQVPAIMVYNLDRYQQLFNYGSFSESSNSTDVILVEEVRNSAGVLDIREFAFSASFSVFAVTAVDRHKFYLIGNDSQGDGIVEKWEKVGPGVAGAETATDANGTPPGARIYSMRKTRLYTLPTLCAVRAFDVDQEERFVYVVHDPVNGGPTELAKLPLPPGPPTTVANSASMAQLATCKDIYPKDHVSLGRVWIIESVVPPLTPGIDRTLIFDTNNSGTIDYVEEMTLNEFSANYYAHSNWIVDGLNHFR